MTEVSTLNNRKDGLNASDVPSSLRISALNIQPSALRGVARDVAEAKAHAQAMLDLAKWAPSSPAIQEFKSAYNWDATEKVSTKLPWMNDNKLYTVYRVPAKEVPNPDFQSDPDPKFIKSLPLYLMSYEATSTFRKGDGSAVTGMTYWADRLPGRDYLAGTYIPSPNGVAQKIYKERLGAEFAQNWEKKLLVSAVHEGIVHGRGRGEVSAKLVADEVARDLNLNMPGRANTFEDAVQSLRNEGYSLTKISTGIYEYLASIGRLDGDVVPISVLNKFPPPGRPDAAFIQVAANGSVSFKPPVPYTREEEEIRAGVRSAARMVTKMEMAGTLDITDQKLIYAANMAAEVQVQKFMDAYRTLHGRQAPTTLLAADLTNG